MTFNANIFLLTTLCIFGIFAFIWDKSDQRNAFVKMLFICMFIWGCYNAYNHLTSVPYMIVSLIMLVYMWMVWKRGSINTFIKIALFLVSAYGIATLIINHLV